MEAVIKTGGKQYRVKEGDIIYVEKLDADVDSTVKFDEVLMLDSKVGNPYVKGASVEGVVLKHGKQRKITIFTYKPKKSSTRRKQGHRQPYTKVEIKKING